MAVGEVVGLEVGVVVGSADAVASGVPVGISVGVPVGATVTTGLVVGEGDGVKNCLPTTNAPTAKMAMTAKTNATIKIGEVFFAGTWESSTGL